LTELIAILVLMLLCGINLLASIRLYKCETLIPFQKKAQFIVIWLLPVIGALLILHLLNDEIGTIDSTKNFESRPKNQIHDRDFD
jgi:hypothetical protein